MTKYLEVFIVTADLGKTEFNVSKNSNTLEGLRLVEFVILQKTKAFCDFHIFFHLLNSNFSKYSL